MLSKSAKYALSAVIFIAKSSGESKLQSKDIAEGISVPKPYVSKLLQALSRHGIISSVKGPSGGFYLSEANWDNRLIDIIYSVDGETRIHSCVMEIESCNKDNPCMLHDIVYPAKEALISHLKGFTLRDLIDEEFTLPEIQT